RRTPPASPGSRSRRPAPPAPAMTRSSRRSLAPPAPGGSSPARRSASGALRVAALGLPLVAIAIGLALLRDLDRHVGWALALLGAAFVAQALAVRRLERSGAGS